MFAKIIKKAYLQDLENPNTAYITENSIVEIIGTPLSEGLIIVRHKGFNHLVKVSCLEAIEDESELKISKE